ncbi:MAG: ABC transporter ATP-binding protein, partial [Desulfuromonadales bacterium]|nr:ABC transporter ATP-binding protein [Desulfuromonadales bacterium]
MPKTEPFEKHVDRYEQWFLDHPLAYVAEIKAIQGLLPKSGGDLFVDKDQFDPSREVGFVFQKSLLLHWRKIIDNVLLPIEILKLDREKHKKRAFELLELVGLKGFES